MKPFNKADDKENSTNGMLRMDGTKLTMMGIENGDLERDKLNDKLKAIRRAKKMLENEIKAKL